MRYERFGNVAAQAIGWICVAIATAVLAAWLTRSIALVQVVPTLFAMQFNTTLCFIATGLAFHLVVANARRSMLGMVLSAVAAVVSLTSLLQQVLVVDLGIDRLLYDPFVTIGIDRAGRMAANTAICFVLVSAGIIMTAVSGRNTCARVLCGLIVFVIASSALLGYAIGVESSHNWRPLAQMSPQTAFCFSLLAAGLVFIGAKERGYPRSTIAAMLAVVTYLLLLLFAYVEMPHQTAVLVGNPGDGGTNPRSTLLGIVLLSGALYAGMFAFSFRSAQMYRDVAGRLQKAKSGSRPLSRPRWTVS